MERTGTSETHGRSGSRLGRSAVAVIFREKNHEDRQVHLGLQHWPAEHIRLSLELFSARALRVDPARRHRFSLARYLSRARWRTTRLRLRLDDLLLFARTPGQQPRHAYRGRMANRGRYSRRSDQLSPDQADELSLLSTQHFFERPSRLHRRHPAAHRPHLYLFPALHRAA